MRPAQRACDRVCFVLIRQSSEITVRSTPSTALSDLVAIVMSEFDARKLTERLQDNQLRSRLPCRRA